MTDTVVVGEPVEITRNSGGAPVLISHEQKMKLDAAFDEIMERRETTLKALAHR